MLHIEFITDLGARVTVDVPDPRQFVETLKKYGRLGWTSGTLPPGGLSFPLEAEADFDWSVIGARKWKNAEGEELILYRGQAYKRRELDEVDSRKMKLPQAVKYSRGAKATDPEHLREKSGEFEYVTLAIFRGNGRKNPRYALAPALNTDANAAD